LLNFVGKKEFLLQWNRFKIAFFDSPTSIMNNRPPVFSREFSSLSVSADTAQASDSPPPSLISELAFEDGSDKSQIVKILRAQLDLAPLDADLELQDAAAAEEQLEFANHFDQPTPTDEELKDQLFSQLTCRPIPQWKRVFDVLAASMLCILLSPLLAAITIFIRLTAGEPIIYKQKRLGLMGKEFEIFKFRTMKSEETATAEHREYIAGLSRSDQAILKPDHSDRLIWGGGILRSLSLDELPQLVNIIRGDMSLIGPRPDVLHWKDYEPWQLKRFEVLPGVTGLWQVTGKNSLTFRQMIERDIDYVDNRSIALDLWIAWKTLPMLVKCNNK